MKEYIIPYSDDLNDDDVKELYGEDRRLIRCKDCKHRPKQTEPPKTYGFSIEFSEGSRCPCQCSDGFYSWYPKDDWFCGYGEREDENDGCIYNP